MPCCDNAQNKKKNKINYQMRKKIVAGNWKMHKKRRQTEEY